MWNTGSAVRTLEMGSSVDQRGRQSSDVWQDSNLNTKEMDKECSDYLLTHTNLACLTDLY